MDLKFHVFLRDATRNTVVNFTSRPL